MNSRMAAFAFLPPAVRSNELFWPARASRSCGNPSPTRLSEPARKNSRRRMGAAAKKPEQAVEAISPPHAHRVNANKMHFAYYNLHTPRIVRGTRVGLALIWRSRAVLVTMRIGSGSSHGD